LEPRPTNNLEDSDEYVEDGDEPSVALLLGSDRASAHLIYFLSASAIWYFGGNMNWDELYQSRTTPWEKGAAAPPLLEWLRKRGALEGEVLVPGCGFGHDVRAIAAASPKSTVVGIDISSTALKEALGFSSVGREVFQSADIFALPQSLRSRFDWVFEHTCFCAIQPQRRLDYIKMVVSALKPEGRLLAIFFLNPWDPEDEIPEGGGPPFGVTKEELDNLFDPHFSLVEELKPKTAYPGREGREIVRLLKKRVGVSA
jgi:methyl halide transferase